MTDYSLVGSIWERIGTNIDGEANYLQIIDSKPSGSVIKCIDIYKGRSWSYHTSVSDSAHLKDLFKQMRYKQARVSKEQFEMLYKLFQ